MDTIEYIRRFAKFLLASEVIGLLLAIKLEYWGMSFFSLFLLSLIAACILVHFFFKGLKITAYLYLISALLYMLMTVLSIIPSLFDVRLFFGLAFWNIFYGISLIIIILGKKCLPPLLGYSRKQIQTVSWEGVISNLKTISFHKAGIAVLAVLIAFAFISLRSSSRKGDRCSELEQLAAEYRELIEENRNFADQYEKKGDATLNRYGNVGESLQEGFAYGLKSWQYSAKAKNAAGKLEDIEEEMRELGCY